MGTRKLEDITVSLIEGGRSADTPVAIVQWAATAKQKVVTGSLSTIVAAVQGLSLSPGIVMIGEVAKFACE